MNGRDMMLAAWDRFPGRRCTDQQWAAWMCTMLRAIEVARKDSSLAEPDPDHLFRLDQHIARVLDEPLTEHGYTPKEVAEFERRQKQQKTTSAAK